MLDREGMDMIEAPGSKSTFGRLHVFKLTAANGKKYILSSHDEDDKVTLIYVYIQYRDAG